MGSIAGKVVGLVWVWRLNVLGISAFGTLAKAVVLERDAC